MISTLGNHTPPADICRANGWGVGTTLRGIEHGRAHTITITAVGERAILAKCSDASHPCFAEERAWAMWCRDWQPVTEGQP